MQASIRKVHFIGIGGTGMCGLAEILLTLDYEVSGSDLASGTEAIERLQRLGARVAAGHAPDHVTGKDLVVVSSAIREENLEYAAARDLGLPILRRGEMLAEIMRLKYGVAVSGAHGKTTTTSLAGHLLSEAGLDPTVVVGGRLRSLGSNARLGGGDVFVAEADESDGSFLNILPTIAVVTNIDREHLDHYGSLAAIRAAFLRFMRSVPFYGAAILCGDDPEVRALARQLNKPTLVYGTGDDCQLQATAIAARESGSRFDVRYEDRELGAFELPLPGRHNVLNALAALAVGLFLGVPSDRLRAGLASFGGVGRRFEQRGEARGVTLVDDYAHHPTEISAVLGAARELYARRRLVVLFQPHRFSRTLALQAEFAGAFAAADLVCVTDIYPAGEAQPAGVSGEQLVAPLARESGVEVCYMADEASVVDELPARLRAGDVLITVGAGPVWRWGDAVLARWQAQEGTSSSSERVAR